MSERLHPGIHLDADSLSAFVEGVLPEHERLACLAHLAECTRCREVVYLAREPLPEQVVPAEPVRGWKRWFRPIPALSAAAAACVLVISIAVYRQNRPAIPAPELTASNRAPAIVQLTPEIPKQPATAKTTPRAGVRINGGPIPAMPPAASVENAPAAPPPPPPAPVAAPAPPTPAARTARATGESGVLAGIAGTVTDPAGAVIPKAQVNLVDGATGRVVTSTSDARGQFSVAGLAPGRYELKIDSPGFKRTSKQIDLQPQEIAKADSTLEVGAATDTVTVTAESSLLKTESGAVAAAAGTSANALPALASAGKLPQVSTAAKDKIVLTADSAGRLFLSKNAGKSWKAVKGRWQGKVFRLGTIPDPADASNSLFQLTTDSASVWLSRDGNRWYPAPAQR